MPRGLRQFNVGDMVRLATRSPTRGIRDRRVLDEIGIVMGTCKVTTYFPISLLRPAPYDDDYVVDFPSHERFYAPASDLTLAESIKTGEFVCSNCRGMFPIKVVIYDSRQVGRCPACTKKSMVCDNCGRWTDNVCDEGYCQRCHNDYCVRLIQDYHSTHYRPRRFLPDDKQKLYLGIELEMESPDYCIEEVAKALDPFSKKRSIFTLEEDGSLDDGLEIVSEPATLAYHKTQFGWHDILEAARQSSAISQDSDNCGLHIHFNTNFFNHSVNTELSLGTWFNTVDLNSAKLLYFFERFWHPLVKFSRRTSGQIQGNARRYGAIHGSPKTVCDIAKKQGRYFVINLGNTDTIEIRLFRGTLNEETFFACLELVDFLARYVKKRTVQYIQRVTWEKVVKAIKSKDYPNLLLYLKRRDLLSVS